MKLVQYIDENGYKRQSFIKEDMPDEQASMGIPNDVPDFHSVDWEDALKELNNLLFDRGIFTLKDVQLHNNGLRNAVEQCFFKRILQVYKDLEILDQEVSNE